MATTTKEKRTRKQNSRTPPGQPLSATQVWLPTLSDTGQQITTNVALSYSTVYACVQLLADSVAGLPWCVYRQVAAGRQEVPAHPWAYALATEPSVDMDSFTFRQTMMLSCLLTGNGYAQIVRDGPDRGLYFLRPDRMTMFRKDSEVVYLYSGGDGGAAFIASEVFHIKAIGFDGLMGQSPLALMRNAIGTAIGQEAFSAGFFRNGARPSGVLKMPGKLDPEAQNRLRSSWESLYAGKSNAGRVAILEQGMEWQSLSIPADDAQFLESRQFQRVEICSAYRVPPHMIGDQTGSSYSNNEQANTEFVQHTLRSWVTRWEMEAKRKLFGREDQHYSRMRFDDLLRGDMVQRAQFYTQLKAVGAISANEIRAREDMNDIGPKGDVYTMSQNETPVDQKVAEAEQAASAAEQSGQQANAEDASGVDSGYADWATETGERMLKVELTARTRKSDGWEPNVARLREAYAPIVRSMGMDDQRANDIAHALARWMRETQPEMWLSLLPVRAAGELLEVCHGV